MLDKEVAHYPSLVSYYVILSVPRREPLAPSSSIPLSYLLLTRHRQADYRAMYRLILYIMVHITTNMQTLYAQPSLRTILTRTNNHAFNK
jgi:hypothetical protein